MFFTANAPPMFPLVISYRIHEAATEKTKSTGCCTPVTVAAPAPPPPSPAKTAAPPPPPPAMTAAPPPPLAMTVASPPPPAMTVAPPPQPAMTVALPPSPAMTVAPPLPPAKTAAPPPPPPAMTVAPAPPPAITVAPAPPPTMTAAPPPPPTAPTMTAAPPPPPTMTTAPPPPPPGTVIMRKELDFDKSDISTLTEVELKEIALKYYELLKKPKAIDLNDLSTNAVKDFQLAKNKETLKDDEKNNKDEEDDATDKIDENDENKYTAHDSHLIDDMKDDDDQLLGRSLHRATHVARKLLKGVFQKEALLKCTFSGQSPRHMGKDHQILDVSCLHDVAKHAIIG
ncbi:PREDICTED: protein diaphanous homolog 1-like [Wasmannia auropunctata]|uniref:protein diaphanous homolog 1-like n=1 Tax=Wasmannia auropunctata TaxID=64793 RepID=UPI0005EF2D56|nr:PREDICTED: protein diaphanous homolog 1-like [Wasmannia auropunctata]